MGLFAPGTLSWLMRLTSEISKSKMDVPKKFGRIFRFHVHFLRGVCSFCETPVSSSIGSFSHFQLTQVASMESGYAPPFT